MAYPTEFKEQYEKETVAVSNHISGLTQKQWFSDIYEFDEGDQVTVEETLPVLVKTAAGEFADTDAKSKQASEHFYHLFALKRDYASRVATRNSIYRAGYQTKLNNALYRNAQYQIGSVAK